MKTIYFHWLLVGLYSFILIFPITAQDNPLPNDSLLKKIQQKPSAAAYYELGSLFLSQNRLEDAREQFIQCIRFQPQGALANRARTKIGFIYYRLAQYEAARKELDKVLLTDPTHSEALKYQSLIQLIQAAELALNKNLFQLAATNYLKVIQQDSANQLAHQKLAQIEQFTRAVELTEKAKIALESQQIEVARHYLIRAESLWADCPDINPIKARLRNISEQDEIRTNRPDSLPRKQPVSPVDTASHLKTRLSTPDSQSLSPSESTRFVLSEQQSDTHQFASKPSSTDSIQYGPTGYFKYLLFFLIGLTLLVIILRLIQGRRQKRNQAILSEAKTSLNLPPSPEPSGTTAQKIGKYEILSELKKGGMGLVVKARHPHFRRPVVIKSILPALANVPAIRERLLREANILFELDHPNIVRVTDLIEENEQLYIVMQFVDGQNLKEILDKQGPLSSHQAVPLFMQACEALIYLHQHDIIHRDIKPENMMLEQQTNILKLVDFGIVKPLDPALEKSLTSTSRIAGTPKYMSPEQLLNDRIDQRSDLFSLGISLFEVLTGTHPFEGQGISVMRAILEKPPTRMIDVKADIDSQLEKICQKLLAKTREQRYQSAYAVEQDLKAYLDKI